MRDDRALQFRGNWIAFDAAMADSFQHVGPPLQADFAGKRLADLVTDPRNLDVESVKREQRAAPLCIDEQSGGIAVEVVRAHELRTERRIGVRAHGTAISAAATRRRSPIMML